MISEDDMKKYLLPIPDEIVPLINQAAAHEYLSVSAYLRQVIVRAVRAHAAELTPPSNGKPKKLTPQLLREATPTLWLPGPPHWTAVEPWATCLPLSAEARQLMDLVAEQIGKPVHAQVCQVHPNDAVKYGAGADCLIVSVRPPVVFAKELE